MKQEYFVVVLAHSLRGRLRRIHIPHQAVYVILALALFGSISVFGFVASYARMAWKVANYNALKREADNLRVRYQNLQRVVSQTDKQIASLEVYANEVSMAYGIKQKLEGPSDITAQGKLVPSFAESVQDYDYLRSSDVMLLLSSPARRFRSTASIPNLWPIDGRLIGGFGPRQDPFSSEGEEIHKGVDIGGTIGTPVHVTADGVVRFADMESTFGRLVVVDHGGGLETWYAHMSKIYVHTGQEVRRAELIGAVGMTGRTTAPHLHYEVHVNGRPVNPYHYLANSTLAPQLAKSEFIF
ncbi:MAG TPA: M23 family metallopeptidase [Bryobacteraceae bacterium]|jgi:murein DD-endopeptidase MepM/ murein hydrolase activator NlpD|nr:M23 family metallopeptidase [Bryobacteraceae bacterium]